MAGQSKPCTNLYVVERPTRADPSRSFIALVAVLPYREVVLSYDRGSIAELLSVSIVDLFSMLKDNKRIPVGELSSF